jgi:hypothetical protein
MMMMMMILDFLKWTFESNLVDRRIPYFDSNNDNNDNIDDNNDVMMYLESLPTFTVPLTSYKVWFEPPSIVFSFQIVWILSLQILIGSLLAVIIYYGIYIPTVVAVKRTSQVAETSVSVSSSVSSVSNNNNNNSNNHSNNNNLENHHHHQNQQQQRGAEEPSKSKSIRNHPQSLLLSSSSSSLSPPISSILLAYGVVIPIALYIPYSMIDQCDIRNIGFRLAWVSMPLTVTLRCLEALYGFVPTTTTPTKTTMTKHDSVVAQQHKSLVEYVMHVALILQPKQDCTNSDDSILPNGDGRIEDFLSTTQTTTTTTTTLSAPTKSRATTIPMNIQIWLSIAFQHYFWVTLYSILYHIAKPYDFYPFTSSSSFSLPAVPATTGLFYWDLPHLYDTFLQAYMLNVSLSLSMTGIAALGGALAGVQMNDTVTDHPLLLSESVSDFWGRRWNNLIHVALKQGVYKPVRSAIENNNNNNNNRSSSQYHKKYSRIIASIAVFCVSGLYHEYVWFIIFFATHAQRQQMHGSDDGTDTSATCCPSCYCDTWMMGKQMFFFGWNGLLIAVEYWMIGTPPPRVVSNKRISTTTTTTSYSINNLRLLLYRLLKSHLIVLLALPVGHLFTRDLTRAGYFDHIRPAIPVIVRIQKQQQHM